MRDSKYDVFTRFQQFIIPVNDTLHLFPEQRIPFQMFLDNQVREHQQEDGGDDQPGDDGGGALVRLGYLLFPVPEGGLCMVADVTEQGEQFAVQFPVADAQAVGVILHVAYPLRLQGDKLFVQRAELVGRGGHLHRFLAAEPSGYAFLLLHDGTGLCRLPCSFWQMVHQQAVGFVLPVEHLHDLVQVCLLVRQQLLQGIYLRQTEYVAMVRLQHLQQAVHPQPSRLVGMVVLILPSDDALAQ